MGLIQYLRENLGYDTALTEDKIEQASHDRRMRLANRLIAASQQAHGSTPKEANAVGGGRFLFSISYDGEKDMGEAGPILDYYNDYVSLRARSWQLWYESDIAQAIVKRNVKWKISRGLRLEAQPNEKVLKSEGYPFEFADGTDDLIEYRWENFAKSKRSSYSGLESIHDMAKVAYKNAIVGGDVLVVLRYEKKQLTIQLIDGATVQSPLFNDSRVQADLTAGRKTLNGVVMDANGRHVAFWVRTGPNAFKRIDAVGTRTNMRMAWLVYGLKYRIENNRGVPLLSVVMETLKKLDRYKEATVGSAEEAAKIALAIEHQSFSTGENPLVRQLAMANNPEGNLDNPTDINGIQLAKTVAATTNKRAINLPVGAKLTTLEHNAEILFKDFFTTNANIVCAAVEIPPEVAFMKYDSNFSASRAALKDWEHTILVDREDFSSQFYQPIYEFWLWLEVFTMKIDLPGFIQAYQLLNYVAIDAYNQSAWKGPTVPHIDPLKEVAAVRAMLGEQAASLPLTTMERATDMLNQGDSDENMQQFKEELNEAKTNGVYLEPVRGGAPNQTPAEDN